MKDAFDALTVARKTAFVSALAIVVGVFLPWVSVLGISVSGISTGDGKLVLIVAAVALVFLAVDAGLVSWFEVSHRLVSIVSLVAAALCLLVAIADLNDFAAIGLYVTLIASITWVAAAVHSLRTGHVSAPESPAPVDPPAPTEP